MAEEKGQAGLEESTSDHAATNEGGGVVDERRLLRKLDWHLIPGLTILLLLSFLDRSNGNSFFLFWLYFAHPSTVGNARIEGLVTDLHMSTSHPSHASRMSFTSVQNKLETNSSTH